MARNIATLKPSERIIEIHDPADEEELLGIKVSIISLSDPRLKKIRRQIQDERNRLEMRGKILKAEDTEDNLFRLTFSAMTGWDWYGDIDFNGTKPEFTRANVFAVFEELEWFLYQIADEIANEKAFFQKSKLI